MFGSKIKMQLLLLTLLPLLLLVLLIAAFSIYQSKVNLEEQLKEQGQLVTEQAVLMSDFYLYTGNIPKLESIAELLVKIKGVESIRFYNINGQVLVAKGDTDEQPGQESFYTVVKSSNIELSDFDTSPSLDNTEPVGSIQVSMSRAKITAKQQQGLLVIIFVALLSLFLGLILSGLFSKKLNRSLNTLVDSAHRVQQGHYDSRCEENGSGELLALQKTFNDMIEALVLNERDLQAKVDKATQSIKTTMQELADKNAELELTKQEAVNLEKSKAIADERSRIMRDMHDGIGGQLVATLALLELEPDNETKNNIAAILKACLDDFRLIINSLNVHANTLSALLADFKYLISNKLEKMDIDLDWDVLALPDDVTIDPQQGLHILRILQEAFTNIMKHSNASTITFNATCDKTDLVTLIIQDNGQSSKQNQHTGHGLENIKWRAEQLSAQLTIDADPNQGFNITLSLPVDSPKADPS